MFVSQSIGMMQKDENENLTTAIVWSGAKELFLYCLALTHAFSSTNTITIFYFGMIIPLFMRLFFRQHKYR